jgi:hypothetical protein
MVMQAWAALPVVVSAVAMAVSAAVALRWMISSSSLAISSVVPLVAVVVAVAA